jgi:hypothetical protein
MIKYIFPKSRMKVHIVGAGPTGMSLAWEILRSGDHEVTIYDKKLSAGGSWWEPTEEIRDLHAHRILFDKAFVNTQSLFSEMGINWDDMFQPSKNTYKIDDYGTIVSLYAKVLAQPEKYKSISLKDAVGDGNHPTIEHWSLIMDGVTWDVMSAYEFVKNIDYVLLSKGYTQRVSGKIMCDAMEEAVLNVGGNFIFNTELNELEYGDDSFIAKFSNGTVINDGMLFLCIDNSPALNFLDDNWGPDADKKVRESTYGALNILLDYDEPIKIKSDLEFAANTEWKLQPVVLSDGKTISCVICNITEEIAKTNPEVLKAEVLKQLDVPEPVDVRIGWGATWNGEVWETSQSSGVLSLHGQLPFFGKCPKVAMCGMMSPRNTPFSSIEASVEVSRALSHIVFETRQPLQPLLLSQVIIFTIVILIVLVLLYRNIDR